MSDNEESHISVGTYAEMFAEFVSDSTWITPADKPLVFHLRRLCAQLDDPASVTAALSSAYLQAFSRLDRRRPGAGPGIPGDLPGQGSIFDELD